jgi:hypothetical protein
MNKKNDNWFFYLLIGIIVAILFWHLFKTSEPSSHSDREAERLRRISDLEREKQLLIDDRNQVIDLEKKITDQSQKLWRKIIRSLILLFALLNLLYFLIMKSFSFGDLITFNTIFFAVINLTYLFITFKLFSIKAFLFEYLKEFSYKIVAGNRDASYFATKLETVQNRIDQIDLELNQLRGIK